MTEDIPPQNEALNENNETKILEESLKECQDKYLRLLAESENARKRMQKERQELMKYSVENAIAEFLQPLDSFEKALKFASQMSDDVKHWAIGFEMILGQFKQVLHHHGVVEYETVGQHFDPHLHEAVEVVENNEVPPGTVLSEFSRGYKVGDRPIKVARVKVSKSPEILSKEENENKE